VIFTGNDVLEGQEVFLKYGLMDNGTIWGHGAYLGPDFSSAFLHNLSVDASTAFANELFNKSNSELTTGEKLVVEAKVTELLKDNRYDPSTGSLVFSEIEIQSFESQIVYWKTYFSLPENDAGLHKFDI
jgi:nitric oxide reductase subunit B